MRDSLVPQAVTIMSTFEAVVAISWVSATDNFTEPLRFFLYTLPFKQNSTIVERQEILELNQSCLLVFVVMGLFTVVKIDNQLTIRNNFFILIKNVV